MEPFTLQSATTFTDMVVHCGWAMHSVTKANNEFKIVNNEWNRKQGMGNMDYRQGSPLHYAVIYDIYRYDGPLWLDDSVLNIRDNFKK